MRLKRIAARRTVVLAAIATLGVASAPGIAAAQAAVLDSVTVTIGGKVVAAFNANNETQQYFQQLAIAPTPNGFKARTVLLVEPRHEFGTGSEIASLGGQDIASLHASDAITFTSTGGMLNVYWISDGATTAQLNGFPVRRNPRGGFGLAPEENAPLYQGSYWGLPNRSVVVQSDVAPRPPGAPEPAAWAMMLLGLGGVGAALRDARRRRAAALA